MLQQIAFSLLSLITFYWAFKQFSRIKRNIFLAKDEEISGNTGKRWKNVLFVAFGQKKMFKNWLPAILHFFIYAAFLITQIELIEIIIDGFSGQHRIFAPFLGSFYTFIISFIEVLSVLAFVATIVFLYRRNLLKIPRFVKSEMTWWPRLDANLILFGELSLIIGIFLMNGADTMLQDIDPEHYNNTGHFAISGWLGPLIFEGLENNVLILIERSGWWLHIITVYIFINYLPSSKHLHIILAFFNVYYEKQKPKGEIENMPEIMNEVKSMMGLEVTTAEDFDPDMIPDFGANDIFGLSWKNILDAYSCTECGRCTAECPANITGKKLSPRKIMMDIRDRVEEVGRNIDSGALKFIEKSQRKPGVKLTKANYNDGKSLFDYISKEEIHACTTCNACVEACPVLINPLEPIIAMRRYDILTDSAGPPDWIPMFTSIENSGSVWQVTGTREDWIEELKS